MQLFNGAFLTQLSRTKVHLISWDPPKKSFVNLVFFDVITLFRVDHKKKNLNNISEKLYFIHIFSMSSVEDTRTQFF